MSAPPWSLADLQAVIARHWGFTALRPLQEQAMRAVLEGRDSLVVLPTGGGKSLCYQAPAALRGDTTVVVSPLISLMKDQVDSLQACGVPAVQIDSSQSGVERFAYETDVRQGAVRVVFVSPERLVLTDFYRLLQRIDVRTFAIDEAHCISHWGHDFRPEYRQLSRLREFFPDAAVHAYTATATERVRKDICEQLGLRDPEVLVGDFDRPNLVYRVLPRREPQKQVLDVINRHQGEAGIVYCIRRLDVDELTAALLKKGFKVMPYHAGLTAEQRKATQDAFTAEECDLIVATVAFGMGIDRSNLRFVLHSAMPKSLEHYQQEAGRAGRDGLEAECVLLYSGADTMAWRAIVEKSAAEAEADPAFTQSALRHLDEMDRYCRGAVCRHRALVEYFDQAYPRDDCGACDLCLGETELVPDSQVVAQKILSCVARVQQRFGIGHVMAVLRGELTDKVQKFRHHQLSTFGLLKDHPKANLRDWVYQLLGQGVLAQENLVLASGEAVPILKLNERSWEVMRGGRPVRLVQLARKEKRKAARAAAEVSWEGVDRGLFEALRRLRAQVAQEDRVPPYVIFNDATLRQLAALRPSTPERMRLVSGVGDAKARKFGDRFLQCLLHHCRQHNLALDAGAAPPPRPAPAPPAARPPAQQAAAFELFRQGASVADAVRHLNRPREAVVEHLCAFIRSEKPRSIAAWVDDLVYQRVASAVRRVGAQNLKPVYLALGETVPYEQIRLVVAHLAR
jgi:ATP-dependent DNA helicase RecQ